MTLRPSIAASVAIGIASRVASLGILGAFYTMIPTTSVVEGPFWSRPFAVWDGSWYVGIASTGYHAQPVATASAGPLYDIAFFPLWPAVIWAGSLGGLLPTALVGGIASNVLFVVACPLIHRALEPFLGSRSALWAVALLAFNPASYVFSLAYSESLFMVFAALAFASPRPIWLVLSAATRLTAGLIGLGTAVDAWLRGDRQTAAMWFVIPLATFGAWMAIAGMVAGRPDGYFLGSPAWYASNGIASGPVTLAENAAGLVVAAYLALLLLGSLAMARRAPGLAVYAIGLVVAALLFGRWESMPRLAMCAFPAFAGLAVLLPRTRAVLVAAFIVLQAACVQLMVSGPFGP
jgi:hypothetical protein